MYVTSYWVTCTVSLTVSLLHSHPDHYSTSSKCSGVDMNTARLLLHRVIQQDHPEITQQVSGQGSKCICQRTIPMSVKCPMMWFTWALRFRLLPDLNPSRILSSVTLRLPQVWKRTWFPDWAALLQTSKPWDSTSLSPNVPSSATEKITWPSPSSSPNQSSPWKKLHWRF